MIRLVGLVVALLVLGPVVAVGLAYLGSRRGPPTRRSGAEIPLAPVEQVRAFAHECAAATVELLLSPFAWLPARQRPAAGRRGIVVLLPGMGQNAAAFWLLRRRLLRTGWATTVGATHGRLAGFDAARARLERRLHELASHGAPLVLLGHGSGGLLARAATLRRTRDAVREVIAIATPCQGTRSPLTRLPGLQELAPGSELLRRLAEADRSSPPSCDRVAIYSDFDATLVPADAAYDPLALNIRVRGVGHFSMLTSRRVFELIAENLPDLTDQAPR